MVVQSRENECSVCRVAKPALAFAQDHCATATVDLVLTATLKGPRLADKAQYALLGTHRKEGKTEISDEEQTAVPPSAMAELVSTDSICAEQIGC
jgi:hypothetical protein